MEQKTPSVMANSNECRICAPVDSSEHLQPWLGRKKVLHDKLIPHEQRMGTPTSIHSSVPIDRPEAEVLVLSFLWRVKSNELEMRTNGINWIRLPVMASPILRVGKFNKNFNPYTSPVSVGTTFIKLPIFGQDDLSTITKYSQRRRMKRVKCFNINLSKWQLTGVVSRSKQTNTQTQGHSGKWKK